MPTATLNRTQAAEWCERVTGYTLTSATLRYWEQARLLRRQEPGHRVPARYGVADLIRLGMLAELRGQGVPVDRVRSAIRSLDALMPEIAARQKAWRLAVTPGGDLVPTQGTRELLKLTKTTGWLAMFDAGKCAREAHAALSEAT